MMRSRALGWRENVQMRFDVTIGICCVFVWDRYRSIVRKSGDDCRACNFGILTVEVDEVGKEGLESSHVRLFDALACRIQILITLASCRIGSEEERSIEYVPRNLSNVALLWLKVEKWCKIWHDLLLRAIVNDVDHNVCLERNLFSKRSYWMEV